MDKKIEALKNDAERLLQSRIKLLREILKRNIVENSGGVTIKHIEEYIEVLENEKEKLSKFEMSIAVVGTMKAGKSTFINAITGAEVLPNRELGMTTMPTKIIEAENTSLTIPESILKLIEKLKKDLKTGAIKDEKKIEIEDIKNHNFNEKHETIEKIQKTLFLFNDMIRIAGEQNINIDDFLENKEYTEIKIPFVSLDNDKKEKNGILSIIDTPGINEEKHSKKLKEIFEKQLKRASGVLLILDYNQLNSKSAGDIKKSVDNIVKTVGDKLFVIVNKFDSRQSNTMDEKEVKNWVLNNLKGEIIKDRIFAVSALKALLPNFMKKDLDKGKKPELKGRVIDWAKKAFDEDDYESEYEEANIEKLRKKVKKSYKKSGFPDMIENVIKKLDANSVLNSIESALDKLAEYSFLDSKKDELYRFLQRKLKLAKKDKDGIEKILKNLKEADGKLQELKEYTEKLTEKTIKSLIHFSNKKASKKFSMIRVKKFKIGLKSDYNHKSFFSKLFDTAKDVKEIVLYNNKEIPERAKIMKEYWKDSLKETFRIDGPKKVKYEEILKKFEDLVKNGKCEFEENEFEFAEYINEYIKNNIQEELFEVISNLKKELEKEVKKEQNSINNKIKTDTRNIQEIIGKNFDMDLLKLPEEIKYNIEDFNEISIAEEEIKYSSYVDKRFWNKFLNFFYDGWGRKSYFEKIKVISIENIEKNYKDLLKKVRDNFKENIEEKLKKDFEPQLKNFIDEFENKLGNFRDEVNNQKEKNENSQKEKDEMIDYLNNIIKELEERIKEIKNTQKGVDERRKQGDNNE